MFFNQSATNVNNPESPSNPILDELMEQLRDSLGYEKFSELETKAIKHLQCAKKYETDENKQAYKELLQQANLAAIQLVCKRFDNKTFFYPTAKDIFHKSDPNTPNKPFPMDQFFTSVEGLEPSYYKDETNKTDVLEGVEKGHLRRNLTDQFYNPHSKFNPRYDVSMAFRAREGYSSWELLNELFQAPNRSAMECLGAIDLTFWLTVKYVLYLTCKPNDKNHKNNAKEKFEELFNQTNDTNSLFCVFDVKSGITNPPYNPTSALTGVVMQYNDISLEQLQANPEKYIGWRIGIMGHPNYLKKHPRGNAQGWNAIFAGEENGKLMFWVPTRKGESKYLEYNEILDMLLQAYNKEPVPKQGTPESEREKQGTIEDIVGLLNCTWFYEEGLKALRNLDKKTLIEHFQKSVKSHRYPVKTADATYHDVVRAVNAYTIIALANKKDPTVFVDKLSDGRNSGRGKVSLFRSAIQHQAFEVISLFGDAVHKLQLARIVNDDIFLEKAIFCDHI